MKKQLKIGTSASTKRAFTLGVELVTQTLAILGKKGSGKTYTAVVIAEQLLSSRLAPVIIDPTGAWWGLKSSADGQTEGFPVVVAGGRHGDLPLDEHSGEILAEAVIEHRFPLILDLSVLKKGAANRLVGVFLETLYRRNQEALHLIIDEADLFAPQVPYGDQAVTLGVVDDVVRRGRIHGLGCTLITQRPQVLNKSVLAQCDMLVAMRLTHNKDLDAIKAWIDVHSSDEQSKAVIGSLPGQPTGTGWFWAPEWGNFCEQVNVDPRTTFDSSATPKVGERIKPPKKLAAVDIETLGQKIADTAKQAKDRDPKTLQAKVQRLEKELDDWKSKPYITEVDAEEAYREGFETGLGEGKASGKEAYEELQTTVREAFQALGTAEMILQEVRAKLGEVPALPLEPRVAERQDYYVPPPRRPKPPTEDFTKFSRELPIRNVHEVIPGTTDGSTVGGAARKILITLAQRSPLTSKQVGLRADLSPNSGHFNNTLSMLRKNQWITGSKSDLAVTEAGLRALGPFEPLPTGRGLLEYWKQKMGNSAGRYILDALDADPGLTKTQIGEATGLSSGSGHFNNTMSQLKRLELVVKSGDHFYLNDELL